MILKVFICFVPFFSMFLAKPLPASGDPRADVIAYLIRYGYLTKLESQNEEKVTEAIKNFQNFFELPETGNIDEEVLTIMTKRRCGISDKLRNRFATTQPWLKKTVTYYIGEITTKLTEQQVADTIRNSLNIWSSATNLTFIRVYNKNEGDIVIFFASGAHEGDNISFDGPGNTLAHAFSPPNGDLHFDNDENWSVTRRGVNLFSVALHELGHSMGLSHSNIVGAVMFPTYRIHRELAQDDINGINELYKLN